MTRYTPASQALDGVEPCSATAYRLGLMRAIGEPGTELWVLPGSCRGMGYPAVALGLVPNMIERLFGDITDPLSRWTPAWRDLDGQEVTGLFAVRLADARRAWWILDAAGKVVAGGPPIYERARAEEIAAKYNARAQLGLGEHDPVR